MINFLALEHRGSAIASTGRLRHRTAANSWRTLRAMEPSAKRHHYMFSSRLLASCSVRAASRREAMTKAVS
ncbi:hypothetical protein [Nostoc sp. CCY0012]|uniref:hypothetical protein n=1 Tax=Nostoc sp. CCY0012 TaxID=1056123 RepID=UPI0039C660F1